jgi:hypothetical protein
LRRVEEWRAETLAAGSGAEEKEARADAGHMN